MKTLKILLTATLLCSVFCASAQFLSTPTNREKKTDKATVFKNTNNYQRFTFSVNLITPETKHQYETIIWEGQEREIGSYSMDHVSVGASFGYIFGINLGSPSVPLFLEVGPELNYSRSVPHLVTQKDYYLSDYWEEWIYDERNKSSAFRTHLLNISSPINLAYRIILGKRTSFAPSAGLNARFHILAKNVYCSDDDGTVSYFDSKSFDKTANRFQLGWNVGLGAYFGNFYLGYKYNSEFSYFISAKDSFYDELKMSFDQHSVSFGYIIQ